jgi:hypothetical protein
MAYQKKTKEQYEAAARERALQKTTTNIETIGDAVNIAKTGGAGTETNSLLMVLISEVMNLNNNLYWINHALKKQGGYSNGGNQSDDVPF